MANILLVDDDAAVRKTVRLLLERATHTVVEAADGRGALSCLGTAHFDLVVTDLNMPEMDGIEVLMALRARGVGVPVVAISGGGRMPKELLLKSAGALGAVTTLAKPFALSELRSAVEEALASRA